MNPLEELQERLALLEAENAAAMTMLAALIRVAPDQESLHLALTASFESAAGPKAGPFQDMSNAQIDHAREIVEHMGMLATKFPKPFGELDESDSKQG